MKKGWQGDQLRSAYKKAFEESFTNNFEKWEHTLNGVNTSIEAIGKVQKKKFRTYTYDEFCCSCKVIIDEHLNAMDWNGLVVEHERTSLKKGIKTKRAMVSSFKRRMTKMETHILLTCFSLTMKSVIGAEVYEKYKNEIEQFNEADIIL